MLDKIRKGKQRKPPRLIIYGQEGIGKSTFGACAPNPIFIDVEDGLGEIDCDSLPRVRNYDEFVEQLGWVIEGEHSYQTLVVDTLDWLEKLVWANVCNRFKCQSIESADGGFAKGYTHALTEWRDILSGMEAVNDRGMNVILIAHAKVERFQDPELPAYDRYTLKLHKHADSVVREWATAVLFATKKTRVEKEDLGFKKTRHIAKTIGSEHVLRTSGSPACVAKNRYDLPAEIPMSWDAFAQAANLTTINQPTNTTNKNEN